MKRVAAAAALLAASCGSSTPTSQHTAHGDLPKLDYAQPRTIETADHYILPERPTRARVSRTQVRPRPAPPTDPAVPAGGGLPPRRVLLCESKGDYRAENPTSSASGGWQITDGTWGGYGGYTHASDAPPDVQDQRAAQLWAGGKGASHWRACL